MYLRITRGRADPARIDELMLLARDMSAAMQRLPGLQSHHAGMDRSTGAIAAVTVWDTEEHARFSRESLGDVVARMQAAGAQLEPPEIYEVLA